jgi:hypothetical protein
MNPPLIRRPASFGGATPLVRDLDELNRLEEAIAQRLEFRTYAQWIKEGRHVRRGESHTYRNLDGEPMFSKFQTDPLL